MKKKAIIGIVCTTLLTASLIGGTYAYLNKLLESKNNHLNSAKFDIDAKSIETTSFSVYNIAPGHSKVYDFEIDKKDTSVNVKYTFDIQPSGELFEKGAPIRFMVYRLENQGEGGNKETLLDLKDDGYVLPLATAKVEKFKLAWYWEPSENDNEFQGKTGEVTILARADQIPDITIFPVVTSDKSEQSEIDKVVLEGASPTRTIRIYDHNAYGDMEFIEDEGVFLYNNEEWSLRQQEDGGVMLKNNNSEEFLRLEAMGDDAHSWFANAQGVTYVK